MNNKVENFFQKELTPKLRDLLIVKSEDGSYNLFGKYKITIDNYGYYVVSKVKGLDHIARFGNLKNAVSYCVFDKNNRKDYNKRLLELDAAISSLDVAIQVHKKLLNSKRPLEDKLIYLTKLEEEKRKKRKFSEEISDYLQTSKIWQNRIYQENTPR